MLRSFFSSLPSLVFCVAVAFSHNFTQALCGVAPTGSDFVGAAAGARSPAVPAKYTAASAENDNQGSCPICSLTLICSPGTWSRLRCPVLTIPQPHVCAAGVPPRRRRCAWAPSRRRSIDPPCQLSERSPCSVRGLGRRPDNVELVATGIEHASWLLGDRGGRREEGAKRKQNCDENLHRAPL